MKLLLDTHALLWWLSDDPALGVRARDLIADPDNEVLVSAVSLWEIVVKARIGKLDAEIAEVLGAVEQDGFTWLGIGPADLLTLSELVHHPDHRDPFDHLLIAQAITAGATFVSQDRNAQRYPVASLPCRDP